jgi:hypothetical protein
MNNCEFCGKETERTYCSLSCSNRSRTAKNETNYNLNPKRCQRCNGPIAYKARFESVYCSRSCAVSVNNKIPKRKKKIIVKTTISHHDDALTRFPFGLVVNRSTLRRCLRETMGDFCALCKQAASWNNQPLTLVVDHIDGDASNNLPSNLRLLCPNCNSQTPTFCGRNLGKGRRARGISER